MGLPFYMNTPTNLSAKHLLIAVKHILIKFALNYNKKLKMTRFSIEILEPKILNLLHLLQKLNLIKLHEGDAKHSVRKSLINTLKNGKLTIDSIQESLELEQLSDEQKLELALELYKENLMSRGQAMALAQIDFHTFRAELSKRKIALHYDEKDLDNDLMVADSIE